MYLVSGLNFYPLDQPGDDQVLRSDVRRFKALRPGKQFVDLGFGGFGIFFKPKYAEIFKELYKGNERPLSIARAVGIGKTQAYTDVPRVRELAEKLYRDMMA